MFQHLHKYMICFYKILQILPKLNIFINFFFHSKKKSFTIRIRILYTFREKLKKLLSYPTLPSRSSNTEIDNDLKTFIKFDQMRLLANSNKLRSRRSSTRIWETSTSERLRRGRSCLFAPPRSH